MPKFAYKAMNRDGKEVFGVIDSESNALAINDIKNLGLFPTTVREATKGDERRARRAKKGPGEFYFGGIKTKHLVVMTRQLSTLIDAGLPLLRSINILIAQQKASKLKDVLREVSSDIQAGATFSESLSKHMKYFDRLYVNMVRAGEVGGMLEVVLQRLAIFMERRQALKRKVKGAMIYPIAVLTIAAGIVWFLLTYIVPEFATVFKDFDAQLPTMTLMLIDIGDFCRFKWWIVVLSITTTLNVLKILSKFKTTKKIMDRVVLKLPLVGDLVTKVAVARFARTLGTLITSGVPILQSLKITKETIGNEVIENAIMKVHDSIKEGDTIAAPLDASKVFPAMVVNMIDVGEETGSLDAMLLKVADIYDAEVEAAVEAMLRLMEPIIIIVLGGIIGFIVIALYLPIFSLADAISGQ
ncbi:MAG TPA: type II secretion system F family protein [Candidatus Hydrogenedentes bacterium]|nr:type II secretion system F family protein [Candidatus Hydrogenedentota bacterium]